MNIKKHINDLERIRPMQGRIDYLRFDMNENPEGLPKDFFNKVWAEITPEIVAMYPEPDILQEEIALYLGVEFDNIIVTNGSDEAIKSLFELYGAEGSKIVSVYPSFEMYRVYAMMFNMEHSIIEYEDDFTLDIDKIINAIDENTSIVSILNPNNPIGTVYSDEDIKKVIKKAEKCGALVIIDEAYHYFYDKTFLNLINEYDNVVILRTFSKLCSIAGLRVGFAVGSKEIIANLEKLRQTFNINTVGVHFAQAILKEEGLIDKLIEIEKEGREYIINKIKESGRDYYSSNGNYLFIKTKNNSEDVFKALEDNKVLVKKYSHPLLKDYIRISTGSKDAMEKFYNIFIEIDA